MEQNQHNDDEISIRDIIAFIKVNLRIIFMITFVFLFLGTGYAFLSSPIFESKVLILPPQQQTSSATAMLAQLGSLAGVAGGAAGLKNPNDLYVGLVKSRSVEEALVKKYNLVSVYEKKYIVDAIKSLENASKITSGKDGLIEIVVEDKDKQLAANLANGYVDQLQLLMGRLAISESQQRRLFFEKQMNQTKNLLNFAEEKLKKFQQDNSFVNLQAESQVSMEATAKLRAAVGVKETELASISRFATSNAPAVIRLQSELSALRGQLSQMVNGRSGDAITSKSILPTSSLEYARLFREVKYQETMFELLAKQWSGAKLDEAKDSKLIQVVDIAVPAERKSKPKRAIILILSLIGGLFFGLAVALTRSAIRKHYSQA